MQEPIQSPTRKCGVSRFREHHPAPPTLPVWVAARPREGLISRTDAPAKKGDGQPILARGTPLFPTITRRENGRRPPFSGTLHRAKNPHIITFSAENCKDPGQVVEKTRLTYIPQIQATAPESNSCRRGSAAPAGQGSTRARYVATNGDSGRARSGYFKRFSASSRDEGAGPAGPDY